MCYLQSNQVLKYPPLAFKEFPPRENRLYRMCVCVCVVDQTLSQCADGDRSDPRQSQIA